MTHIKGSGGMSTPVYLLTVSISTENMEVASIRSNAGIIVEDHIVIWSYPGRHLRGIFPLLVALSRTEPGDRALQSSPFKEISQRPTVSCVREKYPGKACACSPCNATTE